MDAGDSERLLDPRGRLDLARITLAPRPNAAALAAGTLLFYDNEKMDVGHYGLIYTRIKEGLRAQGISRFCERRKSIRGKTSADIAAMAREFSEVGARAAVIALADMGVSPAMVGLAVEMERLGLPTVCLTARPGSRLAAAHAHYRAGSLCLVPFDIYPASDQETLSREIDACIPRLIAMLTTNGGALDELARVDYVVDPDSAENDGFISRKTSRASTISESTEFDAVYSQFERMHIGDGLPVVPPTQARYENMLAYCAFDSDEIILKGIGPSGTPLTVRDALIAAVMAGCRPQYMPIVLTALRAISRPQYGLLQAVTTSFSGGHFVLASGPIAHEIGMHGGQGCLGPGFRANATIGRAVNLALLNVCRAVPGHADLACISSPAEYTYCMAEDAALGPWTPVNEERFDRATPCVMTLKAEPPHAVMDLVSTTASALMETIVDCCTTLGSNNAYVAGCLVLVLNPDHVRLLHAGGYDKDRLRREIHQRARISGERVASRGIVGITPTINADGFHYVTRSPADVEIVAAGGEGGHSGVILPWALHSEAVYEPVRLPGGGIAESLEQFRSGQ
ncbi:MAG: hypothetical protein ACXWI6_14180 [Burkholderiales bacterium]